MLLMGKPKLSVAKSVNGAPSGDWKVLDTPVQDSVNLDTQEGTDLEAREEGGEIVDKISQAATYTLTFELFKKDGVPLPFNDSSGLVSGEYAIRVETGIDGHKAPHIQIDRTTVNTSTFYTVNDTLRKRYKFSALKPASGDTVKVLDQGATEEVETDITDSTETGGGTGA